MAFQRWTKEEIAFLRQNHSTMTVRQLASYLNRHINSVYHKLGRLNLEPVYARKTYAAEEILFLRKNYATMSHRELSKHLKNRSRISISKKASQLGLGKPNKSTPQFPNRRINFSDFKETDWAYMAGILDGEGCFCLVNHKPASPLPYPSIQVTSTSLLLIYWLQHKTHYAYSTRKKAPKWKRQYRLALSGYWITGVLAKVKPYLVIKKEQCSILMEYVTSRLKKTYACPLSKEEQDMIARLHQLNKKGSRTDGIS